jgi:hypothetical protein
MTAAARPPHHPTASSGDKRPGSACQWPCPSGPRMFVCPAKYMQTSPLSRCQLKTLGPRGLSNLCCLDPHCTPTPACRPSTRQSPNHCFAQIIKKSGCLCLTLDIWVVCACDAASPVYAEQQGDGAPHPLKTFLPRHPLGPHPPKFCGWDPQVTLQLDLRKRLAVLEACPEVSFRIPWPPP